jgi:acyl-CoA thioesterase
VIDATWRSWIGAHGGYVAGVLLDAMVAELDDTELAVQSLQAHFLRPVGTEPLKVRPTVEHRGRTSALTSAHADQDRRPAVVATAVHGRNGIGPDWAGAGAPEAPAPEDCRPLPLPLELVPFAQHVEIRPAVGDLPLSGGVAPVLTAWLRFADRRLVDAAAAVALLDTLPPALFATLTARVPMPTIEFAAHFGPRLRTEPIDDWVLARIVTEHAGRGWSVDDAALYHRSGTLLATGRQTRKVDMTSGSTLVPERKEIR